MKYVYFLIACVLCASTAEARGRQQIQVGGGGVNIQQRGGFFGLRSQQIQVGGGVGLNLQQQRGFFGGRQQIQVGNGFGLGFGALGAGCGSGALLLPTTAFPVQTFFGGGVNFQQQRGFFGRGTQIQSSGAGGFFQFQQ